MSCPHNKRHKCRSCKQSEREKAEKKEKNTQLALSSRGHEIPQEEREPAPWWHTRRPKPVQNLSKTAKKRAEGDLHLPGLFLCEGLENEEIRTVRRFLRGKKFKIGGTYLPKSLIDENLKPTNEEVAGEIVWHGTSLQAARSISDRGFMRSSGGMLGAGIYVTPEIAKAWRYCKDIDLKIVIACRLTSPGTVYEAKKSPKSRYGYREILEHKKDFVTIVATPSTFGLQFGGSLRNTEYCVQYPEQLRVTCIFAMIEKVT